MFGSQELSCRTGFPGEYGLGLGNTPACVWALKKVSEPLGGDRGTSWASVAAGLGWTSLRVVNLTQL